MKNMLLAALVWGVAGHSNALFSQSLSPYESRQTHFIWDKLGVSFEGLHRDSIRRVFEQASHAQQAICLALSHRTEPIQNDLLPTGLDSLSQETLLVASRRDLPRGPNSVVLPSLAVAEEHLQGDWTLIHDGLSYNLTLDEPISIEIPQNTTLTSIGLKLTVNGESREQHILFPTFIMDECPEPDLPPWIDTENTDPWWIGCFHQGQAVTGQALIKKSDDGIFDQPVILCEGFDPAIGGQIPLYGHGDMNWETLWNCSANPSEAFEAMPAFIDSLTAMGMDFVFLDFTDGTQSVAKSAALLEHLIGLCNAYQEPELKSPLVVVGASMGGLIARHALRKMELEGTDHCTRLFLSIDSPFRGAWLPFALHHAIDFLSEVSVDAANLNEALNSIAADQMLFDKPDGPSSDFMALQALQSEWGLPQIPFCAAISNGNPEIAFPSPNSPLLYAVSSFLGWEYVHLWLHAAPGDSQYPASDSDNWCVFDAELINTDWEWGEDIFLETQGHCSPAFQAWGEIPGSSSAHLTLLRDALETAGIEVESYQNNSMFIPVHSAFDLPLLADWSMEAIPFDQISTQPLTHPIAMHADIGDHVEKLLNWIIGGQPVDTIAYAHHFGWNQADSHWLGSCSIPPAGKVTIGTTDGNGDTWQPPFFVESAPCIDLIELPQFGTLIVGDTLGTGSGILSIRNGTILTLGPGSVIHIGPLSELNIEKGAQLMLNGGEVIVHPGGALNIHGNGQIMVNETSTIACNGPDGKLQLDGDLIISSGKTLLIAASENHIAGAIKTEGLSGYVHIGSQGSWQVQGSSDALLSLGIENQSGLSVHGTGLFQLSHTQLELAPFSTLEVNSKSAFHQVNLQSINETSVCSFFNRLQWDQGTLHNASISHQHPSAAAMKLSGLQAFNTRWNATTSGLHMEHCYWNQSTFSLNEGPMHSWIRNTSFEEGITELPQLQITSGQHPLRIESTEFMNHSTGIRLHQQYANLTCTNFENLNNAIHLDSMSSVNMAPPFGKNRFFHNHIHVKFSNGIWPELLQGGNEFSEPEHRYFEGTVAGMDSFNENSLLIPCNGNDWGHCNGTTPCMITPTLLETNNDATPIFLKDSTPQLLACDAPTVDEIEPFQDESKGLREHHPEPTSPWMVYPNPVLNDLNIFWISNENRPDHVYLKIFDSKGRLVYSRYEAVQTDGTFSCAVRTLSTGRFTLQLETNDGVAHALHIMVASP